MYRLLKLWVLWALIVFNWWSKRFGAKSFWALMGASTLLAIYLEHRF